MKIIKSTAAQTLLFMITASELLGRGEGVEVSNPGPVLLSSFNFFPSPTYHLERRNVEESGAPLSLHLITLIGFLCTVIACYYWALDDDDSVDENAQNDDSSTEASALSSSSTEVDSECVYLSLGDSNSSDATRAEDSSDCVYLKGNNVTVGMLVHSESSDSSTDEFDAVIDIPDGVPGVIIAVEDIESNEEQSGYRP